METKPRILYLQKILLERTDEENPLSTTQIINILNDEYGISAHRTTVTKDIAALQEFGMDIVTIHSTQSKYFVASRKFELPELKLLIDAVESSKFITKKKSETLIEKIHTMTSPGQMCIRDRYNNRRRDEAYANEVLDDVAEQLAQLLSELKTEKNSFKNMGIDYEEKAFYDILKAVSKKFEFEYPDDKMIELSKRIKLIVDDKSRYTDWSARDDIKSNLQVDLILLLDEVGYPPVTIDYVYKEVLEQAENFKKYAQ